jgi:hypothetical protein
VLPLAEPVVVQPVQTTAAPVIVDELRSHHPWWGFLVGAAGLGLLAYLLLGDDNDTDAQPASP